MRILPLFLLFCLGYPALLFGIAGDLPYRLVVQDGPETDLAVEKDGTIKGNLPFPGGIRIFRLQDRQVFRASREQYSARTLSFDVELQGDFRNYVKAWIYVKDKDGLWYQTEKEYRIYPGKSTRLETVIDELGKHLLPHGHGKTWCAEQAAGIFEAGIVFYSEEKVKGSVTMRGPFFTGKRRQKALKLLSWDFPQTAEKFRMFESHFTLSREYFNPFDPDEIQVDYEINYPSGPRWSNRQLLKQHFILPVLLVFQPYWRDLKLPGKTDLYPAFYTQRYRRTKYFTNELLTPYGKPFWAFRMTPRESGDVRVRLRITDRSGGKEEQLYSEWRTLKVTDSKERGFVRVRSKNPHYFEFSNGEFFFPVSLNIHTNIDRRSERVYKWGFLPDSGTYDYDDYFKSCAAGGITLLEIWMASWTYALEWDSARSGYHGVGRYNLRNAWRLDHLFRLAMKYGIYINLVFAPHGELSFRNDQEWEDNPYNNKGWYAEANGAFLNSPDDYWKDLDVLRYTFRRNRYIAARWGADPHLFAYELWSEVDLVNAGRTHYNSGYMYYWHQRTAEALAAIDPGNHLMSTHVCGDGSNTVNWKDLCINADFVTHIVSDAYRSSVVSFPDQLKKHQRLFSEYSKPSQITEFGGGSFGSTSSIVVGDIHSAVWGALFYGQSASPALWWHDVIHLKDLYFHYKAFADFNKGFDPGANPVFSETEVPNALLPLHILHHPDATLDPQYLRNAMQEYHCKYLPGWTLNETASGTVRSVSISPDPSHARGWVFYPPHVHWYPIDFSKSIKQISSMMHLKIPMTPGSYILDWHDTRSGKRIHRQKVILDGLPRYFPIPPFPCDIAYKLYPEQEVKP